MKIFTASGVRVVLSRNNCTVPKEPCPRTMSPLALSNGDNWPLSHTVMVDVDGAGPAAPMADGEGGVVGCGMMDDGGGVGL